MPTSVSFSDSMLLLNLKDGNPTALKQLYDLYSDRLYCNIFKLVKNETTAQELLQDVFIKLWLKRKDLQVTNIGSYLYSMCSNAVIDHFRKQRNNIVIFNGLIASATQHYSHVEETVFSKETAGLIQKAMGALPPKRRQVFELCKIEGKSYAEVSGLLGISISTINDHIVKATKLLQQKLNP